MSLTRAIRFQVHDQSMDQETTASSKRRIQIREFRNTRSSTLSETILLSGTQQTGRVIRFEKRSWKDSVLSLLAGEITTLLVQVGHSTLSRRMNPLSSSSVQRMPCTLPLSSQTLSVRLRIHSKTHSIAYFC